jgi:hypothetical protein
MAKALQIGQQVIPANEIIPRLANYQMLPQFIRETIIDRVINSISLTSEEQANAYASFIQQNKLTDDISRQAWCQSRYIKQEQLKSLAIRKFKITKFQKSNWGHKIESYFLQRKPQLDEVIYSLICVPNFGVAQELYFRLAEEEQCLLS